MSPDREPPPTDAATEPLPADPKRVQHYFDEHLDAVHRRGDALFTWLMVVQWVLGVGVAVFLSPLAWAGKISTPHIHMYYAILLGGALSLPPILLARFRPGAPITRHTIAAAQLFWSALLIHLSGGRIETHFHVFVSLAFLAFYRDWRLLVTGTLIVVGDHLARGLTWPESVYGVTNPEWWRFLEHAFWVVFEDVVLVFSISQTRKEMVSLATRHVEMEALNTSIERRVVERTQELASSREQYRSLIETTRSVPLQMDAETWRVTYVGPQGHELLGCALEDWWVPGFWQARLHAEDRAATLELFQITLEDREWHELESRLRRDDGTWAWTRIAVRSYDGQRGLIVRGLLLDVTARRRLELELRQSQKLESVGRLASGIAHEINSPIQFVNDSVHFVRSGIEQLLGLVRRYRPALDAAERGALDPDVASELRQAEQEADLPYLTERLPKAIDRATEGLERVSVLVRSMKDFARADQKEQAPADLVAGLEATLLVARNEFKYVADLDTDLKPLPPVVCHAGEVNQACLNLIVNAAHAIGEVVAGTPDRGRITVSTRHEGADAVIEISDTGPGIPHEIQSKIFDPFFTTKEVGKGAGQGLSIARHLIVEKHGGSLEFASEPGSGSLFIIRLPIAGRGHSAAAEAA
jgi:PAS domain S-box-containing protein